MPFSGFSPRACRGPLIRKLSTLSGLCSFAKHRGVFSPRGTFQKRVGPTATPRLPPAPWRPPHPSAETAVLRIIGDPRLLNDGFLRPRIFDLTLFVIPFPGNFPLPPEAPRGGPPSGAPPRIPRLCLSSSLPPPPPRLPCSRPRRSPWVTVDLRTSLLTGVRAGVPTCGLDPSSGRAACTDLWLLPRSATLLELCASFGALARSCAPRVPTRADSEQRTLTSSPALSAPPSAWNCVCHLCACNVPSIASSGRNVSIPAQALRSPPRTQRAAVQSLPRLPVVFLVRPARGSATTCPGARPGSPRAPREASPTPRGAELRPR